MKKDELQIKSVSKNHINLNMLEKNEEFHQDLDYSKMVADLIQNETRNGIYPRIGKYMRIFSHVVLFIGLTIALNSCYGGYVASEPDYVDYARPQRQYDNQIWIDGDWGWNSQTHLYVQKAGYWDSPRQGHTYVKGNWQTTQRGKSWNKGHWQRDNHQKNNHQRDNQQNDNRNR
jgi:hypothetical protein